MSKEIGFLTPFDLPDSKSNIEDSQLEPNTSRKEFQKNMITYGGFESYHFFYGSDLQSNDEDIAAYINSQKWDPKRIHIHNNPLLFNQLDSNKYYAIFAHDLDKFSIPTLRHASDNSIAPALVINNSSSYSINMAKFAELLLDNVLPCDVIVSPNEASQEVIQRSLELMSERLSARLGVTISPFRGKLKIIPPGVDVDYWRPETDEVRIKAKKDLGLPEKACIIFCPGCFSKNNKMDIRPFLIVLQRLQRFLSPNFFKAVLVGDDITSESEIKLIQQFIQKLGLTNVVKIDVNGNSSNIRQYYRAADIFVSLVDNIQQSSVLPVMKAMACGLPVLISGWNGYKDIIIQQKMDFCVNTYWADCDDKFLSFYYQYFDRSDNLLINESIAINLDEVLALLNLLLINRKLRCKYGESCRKHAVEKYSWPVIISQYRDLLGECHDSFCKINSRAGFYQDQVPLFSPEYFERYSHYSSEIISSETSLVLLSTGEELALARSHVNEVMLPPIMEQIFDSTVFKSLIAHISDRPVTFETLVTDVGNETGHPRDIIVKQIMWLIKYGVVSPVKTIEEYSELELAAITSNASGAKE